MVRSKIFEVFRKKFQKVPKGKTRISHKPAIIYMAFTLY